MAAEKIQRTIANIVGKNIVDLFNVKHEPLLTINNYTTVILGIPTWDFGKIQEDWDENWNELNDINFNGKNIALYGLGDQEGYAEWFLDAMGYLHDHIQAQGGTFVGYWPNKGYTFEASKALTRNKQFFVGLALDDDNQFELTDERINNWCQLICKELGLV